VSEHGWKAFLAADGVDDWVVLHGGATAVFRVGSMGEAARLAVSIAAIPGVADSGALLTAADAHLTVRLTRDVWALDERHIEIARAISAAATGLGATADRAAVQEIQVAVAAKPDEIDLGFWRAVSATTP
jgi:4a-hydroxytetrahydrobiopterin dehydratase